MFELIDFFKTIRTELIGWLAIGAIILPGAIVTAALDQMTPLDRGQLWTLSMVFSGLIFVALAYALGRIDRGDEILVWYSLFVLSLMVVAAVLFFGFKVMWVGTFASRFRFGPELFNIDLWMPTVIRVAVTSVIALAGTAVVLLAKAASIVLSRTQVWMLAFLLNAVFAYALTSWGRRTQWFLFAEDPDFPQSLFETVLTGGGLLVVALNVATMVLGCFLYFGVRARMLAVLFGHLAPEWPSWLN